MATKESYERDFQQMLTATTAWRDANPTADLVFYPLGYPEDTDVLAGLIPALIRCVGGNAKTRELLRTMDAAAGNQGTVLLAERCLEQVFGVKRAISGEKWHRMVHTPPTSCPECRRMLSTASSSLGSRNPHAGDICVCEHCAAILRFDETLTVRTATSAERSTLPTEVFQYVQTVLSRLASLS